VLSRFPAASLWQSTQLGLRLMRAALTGMIRLAALVEHAPHLHCRLADRRRKRPGQVLHTPQGAQPPPAAALNPITSCPTTHSAIHLSQTAKSTK
jgi:hypothetical protein